MLKINILLDTRTQLHFSGLSVKNDVSIESYIQSFLSDSIPLVGKSTEPLKPDNFEFKRAIRGGEIMLKLDGERHTFQYSKDVLVDLLIYLSKKDPTVLERISKSKALNSPKRKLLAKERKDLYLSSPHLINCSIKLTDEWFMSTNYSHDRIVSIIKVICKIEGIEYGDEIEVSREP